MGSDETRLKILIEMGLDEKGAKAAIEALEGVKKAQKGSTEETKKQHEAQKQNEDATKNLTSQIRTMALTSAAISGPLIAAAKSYVGTVGMAESTSRSGLAVTYQLEQQWLRVGRSIAKEAIPYVKQFADFAEQGAQFLEKNPAAANAGVQVAGLSTGIGVAAMGASTLKNLGATGAAAGISEIIPPIMAAVGAYIALSNYKLPGQNESVLDSGLRSGGKIIALAAGAFGGPNTALMVGNALGVNNASNDPNAQKPQNSNFLSTQMLQQMRQFQIQEQYAQIDFNRQKFVAQRNLNLQMRYADEDFARTRMRSLRDFNLQFQFSEQMFYRQRAIALRDFTIQVSRTEEDYQISRTRAAYDHNFELKQIMLSGDVMQYYYAERQYQLDKSRAEEDYQRQKSRTQQDFARSQGDQLQEFTLQRNQQLLQYNIQLNDQVEDFKIQRKRQLEQYQISLDDMDYQYKLEKDRRWKNFQEQILPALMIEDDYRAKMMDEMNVSMIDKFNSLMSSFDASWGGFINTIRSSDPNSSTAKLETSSDIPLMNPQQRSNAENAIRANPQAVALTQYLQDHGLIHYDVGGYSKYGPAILHDNEFVMTAETTKHAEQVAKGTLTQDKLMSMMSQKGFEYNDNRSFSRGLTSEEREEIDRDNRRMLVEAFG